MSNGIEYESIWCLRMWTGREERTEALLSYTDYTSCSLFFAVLALQTVDSLGSEMTRLD